MQITICTVTIVLPNMMAMDVQQYIQMKTHTLKTSLTLILLSKLQQFKLHRRWAAVLASAFQCFWSDMSKSVLLIRFHLSPV